INGTTATDSSHTLTLGQTYFVTVRATSGAGLQVTATSDGVTVDNTAPTVTGLPNDGTAADIDFQTSTTTLSANWAGVFADAESGISGYEWAVGSSPGGYDLLDFTTNGISGTTATATGLNLALGGKYFVTVRATNGAGVQSTATSDGVTVDNTAPYVF